VVVTGVGAVHAKGTRVEEIKKAILGDQRLGSAAPGHDKLDLQDFKAAPHITDRRMLKAVSNVDAIGLAAIEGLCKDVEYKQGTYPAERVGLYVGAPPATSYDNEPYMDALKASKDREGRVSATIFGKNCMSSRPTTLLLGLPNNVLCYGAMILDAKGPNSNYTAQGLSGQLAVINAARRIQRGKLDLAVAGGFNLHSEPVNSRIFKKLGLTDLVTADGAAFVSLERREAATSRGAKVLATYLAGATASDGMGPLMLDVNGEAYEGAIRRALAQANVGVQDIGLVLASGTGVSRVDACEFSVLSRVFANARDLPAVGSFFPALGHMMEASGLLELGLLSWLYELGELPSHVMASDPQGPRWPSRIDSSKPYALILKASPWGEYGCVVARKE
jgi:3-oxoacyl-(acyl-carrier-protein) synthase